MNSANAPLPTPTIDDVIAHLRRALDATDPGAWAVLALDAMLHVAGTSDLAMLAPEKVREVSRLALYLAPRLADCVGNGISAERIYFGLAAASQLLSIQEDGFRFDRTLHAGLLHADLKSHMCRKRLDERGDPLMRYARARQAWDAPRLPSASTQ